jgi:copper(I)-binding protein
MTTTATAPPAPGGPDTLRDLARAAAGPVICATVLIALLSAWAGAGGAGTLTRIKLQVTQAAVPMRAFTPQAAATEKSATTFLTIRNLTATPDELVSVTSPIARRVILTERSGPAAPRSTVTSLTIPARGTLTLSPLGADIVLQDPIPYETLQTVPLTLTFQHSGTVTIDAPVTAPGTP